MNTSIEKKNGEFEGKVVIVTGAASGIGLATAKLFAAEGASVVAEDINPGVNEVFGDHDRIVPFVGDVATESAAKEVVDLAVKRFGKLDILVNNAASIVYKNAIDMSLDEWNSIINISATGLFLHSREALKVMIPNKSGAIVNLGSYACFFTFPGISAYAAAKGALAQITRTLALEAIEHGIRINAVGSGDVVTNLLNTFRADGREFLAEHGKLAPIKRAAEPEEIANVVAFLASDKASFIVGAIVMADGGMSVVIQ
jgi:NAD(P)-dependent dehydrogenase (short-subunit alcohol dehydrogenase family)